MEITPAISTRYADYLRSFEWRKTRNRALKRAGYSCQRCSARRDLQVHHLTYERLGREWDSDLEVVCRECHEGEHVQEMHDAGGTQRLYLKLANEVLRASPYDSIADLSDAVKERCAQLKITYDKHQVEKALGLICGVSFGAKQTTTDNLIIAIAAGRAPTHREAVEFTHLLRAHGLGDVVAAIMKPMPSAKPSRIDIYGPIPREDFGDHDLY